MLYNTTFLWKLGLRPSRWSCMIYVDTLNEPVILKIRLMINIYFFRKSRLKQKAGILSSKVSLPARMAAGAAGSNSGALTTLSRMLMRIYRVTTQVLFDCLKRGRRKIQNATMISTPSWRSASASAGTSCDR